MNIPINTLQSALNFIDEHPIGIKQPELIINGDDIFPVYNALTLNDNGEIL